MSACNLADRLRRKTTQPPTQRTKTVTSKLTDNLESLRSARDELDEVLRDYTGQLDAASNCANRLEEVGGEIAQMKSDIDPLDTKAVLKLIVSERQVQLLAERSEERPPSPGPLRQALTNAADMARRFLSPKLEALKSRRVAQISDSLGGITNAGQFLANDATFQASREFVCCRWGAAPDAAEGAQEGLAALDAILTGKTPFDDVKVEPAHA
jgi:hypothetical protein